MEINKQIYGDYVACKKLKSDAIFIRSKLNEMDEIRGKLDHICISDDHHHHDVSPRLTVCKYLNHRGCLLKKSTPLAQSPIIGDDMERQTLFLAPMPNTSNNTDEMISQTIRCSEEPKYSAIFYRSENLSEEWIIPH